MIRSTSLALVLLATQALADTHLLLQVDPNGVVRGFIPGGQIEEPPPPGWTWLKVAPSDMPRRQPFNAALIATLRVSGTAIVPRQAADVAAEAEAARRARTRAELLRARATLDAAQAEVANDPGNADLIAERDAAQAEVTRLRSEAH